MNSFLFRAGVLIVSSAFSLSIAQAQNANAGGGSFGSPGLSTGAGMDTNGLGTLPNEPFDGNTDSSVVGQPNPSTVGQPNSQAGTQVYGAPMGGTSPGLSGFTGPASSIGPTNGSLENSASGMFGTQGGAADNFGAAGGTFGSPSANGVYGAPGTPSSNGTIMPGTAGTQP